MSKIDEIRKRHEVLQAEIDARRQQGVSVGIMDTTEHRDRATLIAALDGEWQSERPAPGRWYVSRAPDIRGGSDPVVEVEVFASGLVFSRRSGKGEPLDHPQFTGALWQRRTVPADPFAKGGGE